MAPKLHHKRGKHAKRRKPLRRKASKQTSPQTRRDNPGKHHAQHYLGMLRVNALPGFITRKDQSWTNHDQSNC
jgi:hypothetical protein